jgi:hypothetical protein
VKHRYSEEQIIAILHEAAATPTKVEVYRQAGIRKPGSRAKGKHRDG